MAEDAEADDTQNDETPVTGDLDRDEIYEVLSGLSAADWKRIEYVAGGHALGLVGCTAADLQQEAMTRLLEGRRRWPRGYPALVVLDKVMYSLSSNWHKRSVEGPIDTTAEVTTTDYQPEEGAELAVAVDFRTPETSLNGAQKLQAIEDALDGDEDAQLLLMAWVANGPGKAACEALGWDAKKHDAARKRFTRALDRIRKQEEKG